MQRFVVLVSWRLELLLSWELRDVTKLCVFKKDSCCPAPSGAATPAERDVNQAQFVHANAVLRRGVIRQHKTPGGAANQNCLDFHNLCFQYLPSSTLIFSALGFLPSLTLQIIKKTKAAMLSHILKSLKVMGEPSTTAPLSTDLI